MYPTNKTSLKLVAAAGILTASVATASAKIDWGGSLGECYNNVITYCNAHTDGYPDSCYNDTLDMCDSKHASMTQVPAKTLKSMRSSSLRKAKRAQGRVKAPVRKIKLQPVQRAN